MTPPPVEAGGASSRALRVATCGIAAAMGGPELGVVFAWLHVVCLEWVALLWSLSAKPAGGCCVAYLLCASLVVAFVVRACLVAVAFPGGLAWVASFDVGGEVSAG